MLYNLLLPFADHLHILNLIRYLTFRSGAACLTSLDHQLRARAAGHPHAARLAEAGPADPP